MTKQNVIHREKVCCEKIRKRLDRLNQKYGCKGRVVAVTTPEGKRYGRKIRHGNLQTIDARCKVCAAKSQQGFDIRNDWKSKDGQEPQGD